MRLHSIYGEGVERALDAFAMRHTAIASNIANINTPGYVKQTVDFEQSLIEALNASETAPAGLSADFGGMLDGMQITAARPDVLLSWQPAMTSAADGPQRLDGNRTTVETEMSGMAYNAIKYNALSSVVAKEYQMLKSVAQAR